MKRQIWTNILIFSICITTYMVGNAKTNSVNYRVTGSANIKPPENKEDYSCTLRDYSQCKSFKLDDTFIMECNANLPTDLRLLGQCSYTKEKCTNGTEYGYCTINAATDTNNTNIINISSCTWYKCQS